MLVLRPGALGDTLLAVPALRVLRRRHGRLKLAAHAGAARLLEMTGEVDEGLAFDDPSLAWVFAAGAPAGAEPALAWLKRGSAVHPLVSVQPSLPGDARHVARHLFQTVDGDEWDERPLRLEPLQSGDVLVHPGSGSPAKNWPPQRFAAVLRDLRLRGVTPRIVIGEADEAALRALAAHLEGPADVLRVELIELARRLAGCRAYLGNDSGVSHLAGLSGARTVVLFGPTAADSWRPLGPRVTALDFECDVDEVVAALRS